MSRRVGAFLIVAAALCSRLSGLQLAQTEPPCDVTVPNGVVAGSSERNDNSYGNALLSVGPFGLWPDGTVVFGKADLAS